ncbi:MAG TPA: hypothetical protein PLV92_07290 [Pirellulaceae bacterium]|nr:hypothetical protein [Pirellulaceae bacterium]
MSRAASSRLRAAAALFSFLIRSASSLKAANPVRLALDDEVLPRGVDAGAGVAGEDVAAAAALAGGFDAVAGFAGFEPEVSPGAVAIGTGLLGAGLIDFDTGVAPD